MDPVPLHLLVRAARDRIIDILGLGQTHPLEDVMVEEEQLTVNFGQPCSIDIAPGQTDVTYELCDDKGASLSPQILVAGNGGTTIISGPKIDVDRTFDIRAFKTAHPDKTTYLAARATVRVGLDTSLPVTFAVPGFASYGSQVEVRVAGTQVGATYQLVYPDAGGVTVTTDPVAGTGGVISLFTKPVTQDALIEVHANRVFDPSEHRTDLHATLATKLPLAVLANPGLGVSIDVSPLVDPLATFTLTIVASQAGVTYTAFARPLLDADFEVDRSSGAALLSVQVPASLLDVTTHEVLVHDPPRPFPFQVQSGYTQLGNPKAGTGGDLKLTLGPLHDDTVLVIRAHKDHPGLAPPASSEIQLQHAAVALPRPDPAAGLTLTVTAASGATGGTLLVTGGQAGVFYHFRRGAETTEIGLPGYFHRVDENNPLQNHGVEQNRLLMDFVIARDPPAGGALDPTQQRPQPPLVDITPLPLNNTLSVMAVRARTGVGWTAPNTFTTKSS